MSSVVNSTRIQNITTEIVTIYWGGNSDIEERFEIKCNFVPDVVEFQMAVTDTVSGNLYSMESNLLPPGQVLLAMHGNTYNPVLTIFNAERKTYQGWYNARCYRVIDRSAEPTMQATLVCKFTRFAV